MFCINENVSSYFGEGEEGYLEGICEKGTEQRKGADEASPAGLGVCGGAVQAATGGTAAARGDGRNRLFAGGNTSGEGASGRKAYGNLEGE